MPAESTLRGGACADAAYAAATLGPTGLAGTAAPEVASAGRRRRVTRFRLVTCVPVRHHEREPGGTERASSPSLRRRRTRRHRRPRLDAHAALPAACRPLVPRHTRPVRVCVSELLLPRRSLLGGARRLEDCSRCSLGYRCAGNVRATTPAPSLLHVSSGRVGGRRCRYSPAVDDRHRRVFSDSRRGVGGECRGAAEGRAATVCTWRRVSSAEQRLLRKE